MRGIGGEFELAPAHALDGIRSLQADHHRTAEDGYCQDGTDNQLPGNQHASDVLCVTEALPSHEPGPGVLDCPQPKAP
jgi:hypothetical protein